MKPWIAAVAVAVLVAAMTWVTLREGSGISCEVCMDFGGASHCAKAQAPVLEEAQQGAIMNACSTIAHGVTQLIACQRATPRQMRCEP